MDKQQLKQWMAEWYQRNNSDPVWKEKRNRQRAEKRRENKRRAVEFMGGVCQKCGGVLPDCCYDFHHKDPTDTNDVPSSVLHCSWNRIVRELEKCIMVCSNCHRIIHSEDGYVAHEKRKRKLKEAA